MAENYSDKMSVLQVLGGLAKNPMLFLNREYRFDVADFPEQFHKIVFSAIEHLASNGVEKISPIDVDQFLSGFSVQYRVFSDNRGMEYLSKAMAMAEDVNFPYYYTIVKKFGLLNKLRAQGFDVSEVYDPKDVDPKVVAEKQEKFVNMSVTDLMNFFEAKLLTLKQEYGTTDGVEECQAGEGMVDLIEQLEQKPEFGVPLCSPKLTTICRGRRLKKFYIESAVQGAGKSRRAAGEACHLAVPEYFNTKTNLWEHSGFSESVLLISTELEASEVQTMFLAYVSGVPEHHILDGRYFGDERARVVQAAQYIAKSNLFFVQISDFDVDDIENLIKKYHYLHGVNYVFYDYLSTSMKIMAGTARQARVSDLKEYQILNLFGQRLKTLCNVLNIHIQTATQLSGNWKTEAADQQLLRGAKSLADQPDIGSIMLPIRDEDKPIVDAFLNKGFELAPNMVIHVYKTRRTGYNNVRLYVYFDRATCRIEDCFATDNEGHMLDIENTKIEEVLDRTATRELPEAASALVF